MNTNDTSAAYDTMLERVREGQWKIAALESSLTAATARATRAEAECAAKDEALRFAANKIESLGPELIPLPALNRIDRALAPNAGSRIVAEMEAAQCLIGHLDASGSFDDGIPDVSALRLKAAYDKARTGNGG